MSETVVFDSLVDFYTCTQYISHSDCTLVVFLLTNILLTSYHNIWFPWYNGRVPSGAFTELLASNHDFTIQPLPN